MSDTDVIPAVQSDEPPADADLPGQLAAAAPRRWGNRATPVLLVVALMAGAFLGGVQVQRKWGTATPSSASSPSSGARFPGARASGFPGGGFPGGGAPGGGSSPGSSPGGETATIGTIKTLTATEVTIETSTGATVVVKIADSTTISKTTTLAELKTGQSITVRGAAAADGIVTATALTAS